jgi:hypothetical protein
MALVAFAAPTSIGAAWTGAGLIGGTWNGIAASATDPSFTFPIQANVWVGSDGTPRGQARLGAPLNCSLKWTARRQQGAVTIFSETVTHQVGHLCEDGGTVRVSTASGGRVRYVWRKGALSSLGYLDGIAGSWAGMLAGSGNTHFPANLIIRGTTRGGIEGSVGYGSPLSCSGRWTPLSGNTPGWRRFTETITRSSSRFCVGVGAASVRLRRDGRLQYRWTSGGLLTTGVLTRAPG